jgi:hypothetical protein
MLRRLSSYNEEAARLEQMKKTYQERPLSFNLHFFSSVKEGDYNKIRDLLQVGNPSTELLKLSLELASGKGLKPVVVQILHAKSGEISDEALEAALKIAKVRKHRFVADEIHADLEVRKILENYSFIEHGNDLEPARAENP